MEVIGITYVFPESHFIETESTKYKGDKSLCCVNTSGLQPQERYFGIAVVQREDKVAS